MTTSPTFVAKFADSEVTRMTTHTQLTKLDLARGVTLSLAAYESRKKRPAPAIIEAHFENGAGAVLESYDAKRLPEAAP